MGMSTHISGVRDLDGQFAKMLKAKQACEAAGISYPAEVAAYFGNWINYKEETIRREMVKIDIDDAVEEGGHDSTNA